MTSLQRRAVLGSMIALVVAGCAPKHATPPASEPAPRLAAESVSLSPLQQALREIRDDGTWSKETALKAFAAAFGELPGVSVPDGPRPEHEQSCIAFRMLMHYWSEITPEQRTTARQIFGSSPSALRVPQRASIGLFAAPGPSIDLEQGTPEPTTTTTAPAAEVAEYQRELDRIIAEISKHVDRHLSISPIVLLDDVQVGAAYAEAFLGVKANKAKTVTECRIHIYPKGRKFKPGARQLIAMLGHEAWHCFQADRTGALRHRAGAPWIIEGEATWVGETLAGGGGSGIPTASDHWRSYVMHPEKSLFTRDYDALGFYSHLEYTGSDVWHMLDILLGASADSPRAFTAAIGTGTAFFTWGSGWFLDGTPTRGFTMSKEPGRPDAFRASPKLINLANGDTDGLDAKRPATVAFAQVHVSTDVLRVQVMGRAIVGDPAGPVYELSAETRTFCVKAPCKCPDNTMPLGTLTPIGAVSKIAVAGDGLSGSNAVVTGISMEELCKNPALPPRQQWQGSWKSKKFPISGTFELDISLTATKLDGDVSIKSSDCTNTGRVVGSISNGTVKFGTVASGPGVAWAGTISGNTMSGTYTAPGCGDDHGVWSARR